MTTNHLQMKILNVRIFPMYVIVMLFFIGVPISSLAGNIIAISSGDVEPGESISVEVIIDNSDDFVAFQLDIPLPAQLSYEEGSAKLNPKRIADHSLSVTVVKDNILRIISFSLQNQPFLGNSGPIMYFDLTAGAVPGDYLLEPTNAIIGEAGGNDIITGTTAGTITILGQTALPDILILDNHLISSQQDACFNALQTVILADEVGGWFLVESGGSAEIIAGESIHMFPGTTVEHGGYLLARIAEHDDDYCPIPRTRVISNEPFASKEEALSADFLNEISENSFFKVYPNPTRDQFTLELHHYTYDAHILVEVYSMRGKLIKRKQVQGDQPHTFSLEDQPHGIYLIRVMQEDQVDTERIIKR